MNVWTIVLLYALIALVGAALIERTKSPANSEGSCSCLEWGTSAHPSGVRRIHDANCPVHKEG